MNYTLNQLHIFLKVVKACSITKAAEELHLTQPAVSIQLKNFQDQFDIPLTEVVGRKLYVTDFGLEVAEAAESIVQQVQAINHKALAYKGKLSGKLKIAIVSTGKYVMPHFLSDFLRENEGIELAMDVTNKEKVIQNLERNEVDFALVSVLPENMNIERLDLLQNKLFLVGSADRIPKKASVTVKEFNSLPLIFREQGSGTRQTMEAFIKKLKLQVEKKMELTSNEAVKQAVLAGLGFSIMPLIGIKNELHNQELKIIGMKGLPIKTTWSLIWLKGKRHALAPKAFLDHIKKNKASIVNQRFDWYEQY